MSSVLIALVCGVGVGAFAWSKLTNSTGNAHPGNLLIAAGVVGAAVFLFLLSFFRWVLGLQ